MVAKRATLRLFLLERKIKKVKNNIDKYKYNGMSSKKLFKNILFIKNRRRYKKNKVGIK